MLVGIPTTRLYNLVPNRIKRGTGRVFRDTWIFSKHLKGYFCKYIKGYGILGSILGIWGYNAFRILGIFAILILWIWDSFQNNLRDNGYWDPPSRASNMLSSKRSAHHIHFDKTMRDFC